MAHEVASLGCQLLVYRDVRSQQGEAQQGDGKGLHWLPAALGETDLAFQQLCNSTGLFCSRPYTSRNVCFKDSISALDQDPGWCAFVGMFIFESYGYFPTMVWSYFPFPELLTALKL